MSKTKLSFSLITIIIFIILAVLIYLILSFNICIIGKNVTRIFLYFTAITGVLITFLGISEDNYTILFRRFVLSEIPNVIQIITLPSILIILFDNAESLIIIVPLIYFLVTVYLLEKMHLLIHKEIFNDSSTFNVFKLRQNTLHRKFNRYFTVTIVYLFIVI